MQDKIDLFLYAHCYFSLPLIQISGGAFDWRKLSDRRKPVLGQISRWHPADEGRRWLSKYNTGPIPALVRRLFDYRQMDFEQAFDQLMALMSTEPKRAYISSYYRKQTKNQWARDDPAFLVIQAGLVALGSLFYTMIFESPSFWGYLWTTLYGLLIDWLLIGFIAATITSFVANRYLRQYHSHTVEQSVSGRTPSMCI